MKKGSTGVLSDVSRGGVTISSNARLHEISFCCICLYLFSSWLADARLEVLIFDVKVGEKGSEEMVSVGYFGWVRIAKWRPCLR